jgi:hypothetical protein
MILPAVVEPPIQPWDEDEGIEKDLGEEGLRFLWWFGKLMNKFVCGTKLDDIYIDIRRDFDIALTRKTIYKIFKRCSESSSTQSCALSRQSLYTM